MPVDVIMPKVDMDMATGKVVAWHVLSGAAVKKGQPLFDIETDKAAMEIECPADGILGNITSQVSDVVPIGHRIAQIFLDGESPTQSAAPVRVEVFKDQTVHKIEPQFSAPKTNVVLATPLAKRMARERGIDLVSVKGSGPRGRIVSGDLPNFQKPQVTATRLQQVQLSSQIEFSKISDLAIAIGDTASKVAPTLDLLLLKATSQAYVEISGAKEVSVAFSKSGLGAALSVSGADHLPLSKFQNTNEMNPPLKLESYLGSGVEQILMQSANKYSFEISIGDARDGGVQLSVFTTSEERETAVQFFQALKRRLEEPALMLA